MDERPEGNTITVLSIEHKRTSRRERNKLSTLSDRQRIEELENQIRKLVDIVEEIQNENAYHKKLIRKILHGLSTT